MPEELVKALKGQQIIETLQNYPVAFDTDLADRVQADTFQAEVRESVWSDTFFWRDVMHNGDAYWDSEFDFEECIFSYWVPRIPGLIFTRTSTILRNQAKYYPLDNAIVSGNISHIYAPLGKSMMVSSGIGTIKFPEDHYENILGCVTFSANASAGIPVLISREVYRYHKIQEGDVLKIKKGRWKKMSLEWISKFPAISGIPRGYILIDDPKMIVKSNERLNLQIQPFSIIEQSTNNSYLYDFVYVTVNAIDPNGKKDAVKFFEEYRKIQDPAGEYLLAIDPADPFFEARYTLPQDLEKLDRNGITQMNLIKERIKGASFNGFTLDSIASLIPKYYTMPDDLLRLAADSGIPPALIIVDAAARMTASLLEQALRLGKVENVLDIIASDHAEILN
jgi:hypothetical protein